MLDAGVSTPTHGRAQRSCVKLVPLSFSVNLCLLLLLASTRSPTFAEVPSESPRGLVTSLHGFRFVLFWWLQGLPYFRECSPCIPDEMIQKLGLTLLRLDEVNGRYVECKVCGRTESSKDVKGVGAPGSLVSRVVRWI